MSAKRVSVATGYGVSALTPRAKEYAVPVAEPDDLDDDIEYLVDSGADFDILNLKKGMKMVKRHVREAQGEKDVQTGGGDVTITHGVRAQVASWDLPNDFFLLKDAPTLMSMGKRTRTGPFSFFHGNRKVLHVLLMVRLLTL